MFGEGRRILSMSRAFLCLDFLGPRDSEHVTYFAPSVLASRMIAIVTQDTHRGQNEQLWTSYKIISNGVVGLHILGAVL